MMPTIVFVRPLSVSLSPCPRTRFTRARTFLQRHNIRYSVLKVISAIRTVCELRLNCFRLTLKASAIMHSARNNEKKTWLQTSGPDSRSASLAPNFIIQFTQMIARMPRRHRRLLYRKEACRFQSRGLRRFFKFWHIQTDNQST